MKRSNLEPKRPNALLYHIAVPLAGLYARLAVGLKVNKTAISGIKPPFVVLSNHASNMDFMLTSAAMHPVRMNYVAGAYLFSKPLSRWAYSQMGAISKQQFTPDLPAVRKMKNVVDRGGVLILFPSGQSSFSGECSIIPHGIERLLKMLAVPVVSLHIDGAHLCYPKWNRSGFRKTEVQVTVQPLLTTAEISKLSPDAIYETVCNSLYFDDYEWQRSRLLPAKKPRIAEGLQKVLYACPRCRAEFCMETSGSKLYCMACGNGSSMDRFGLLQPLDSNSVIFDTPVKWRRWQMEQLGKKLEEPGFRLETPVELSEVARDNRQKPLGKGRIVLSIDGMDYQKAEGDGPERLHIDSSLVPVFPHEAETSFDAFYDGRHYRFAPENHKLVFQIVELEEMIFRRLTD
jgi:1-acyl-sn-glycerol-3-phosphate acyltransferase